MEKAIFGAGCFWQVEIDFANVEGVTATAVGYSGGEVANPSYELVCGGRTGHAEVVQVEYDPAVVSYDQLLDVFFEAHDPTQVNRQGWDVGHQYRSAIFYLTPEQHEAAVAAKARAQQNHRRPIATEITAAGPFYRAEEYHQRYLEKRGMATCRVPATSA
ncbi:MAG: peptide-methionine (S)-S-oxide reductase MsrA [Chloroflexi bacterium]|nr:MAG: peptide-methionine (S)-S-oxide reductase MsrA [Chloroflexota bacterium]TMD55748.1 MAG: peptide-methionine (S)-S-oxide reductase MsrA [Chloroflexota bacterium]